MAWDEKGKKWYKLHWQEYYSKNRERIVARNAKFRARNREKVNAKARAAYQKNITPEKRAKMRANSLAYYYKSKEKFSAEKRKKIRRNYRKWEKNHPQRVLAHRIIQNEIERGRLIRPETCSQCGKPCKPEAHHPDYAIPLSIVWLCRACHNKTRWL